MFDRRSRLTRDVNEQLISHCAERVCDKVVPRHTRLAEAPRFASPAIISDKHSRGAVAYLDLAHELDEKYN